MVASSFQSTCVCRATSSSHRLRAKLLTTASFTHFSIHWLHKSSNCSHKQLILTLNSHHHHCSHQGDTNTGISVGVNFIYYRFSKPFYFFPHVAFKLTVISPNNTQTAVPDFFLTSLYCKCWKRRMRRTTFILLRWERCAEWLLIA